MDHGFLYNPNSNTMGVADSESEVSGILEIYVHHARNIHNICIYDNQDVYAKFSLTYNPDETTSTKIVNGGGKNPDFNERLIIKVTQLDGAVLKCEIWMLSRARNYLEDQLLGFALVPISQVVNKGKFTNEYNLSSTDLFHSPAGTVKLTLSFKTTSPSATSATSSSSSISSEVVLLDTKIDPVEYSRIEFPDINVVRENQQMVSEYFDTMNSISRPPGSGSGSCPLASLLRLGSSSPPPPPPPQHHNHQVVVVADFEMTINSCEEYHGGSISPNSGLLSSTTTSLSGGDDRNMTKEANQSSAGACPDTPTSKKGSETNSKYVDKQQVEEQEKKNVLSVPLGSMKNMEEAAAEQTAMQQQIVDMYMRSMQQFTESLAKMKLPINLDKPQSEDDPLSDRDVIQTRNNKLELDNKKKDGSRVFYGSRAFF